jgi:hypothetical protein
MSFSNIPRFTSDDSIKVREQADRDYIDNVSDVAWTADRVLSVSTGAWTRTSSQGTPNGTIIPAVIKGSAGRVRRAIFNNIHATIGHWGFIKNKATAMVAGEAPDVRIWCPPSSATMPGGAILDFGPSGMYFSTGIAISFSLIAAPNTLTVLATDNAHYSIEWL